jgi:hypothetical protein
VKKMLLAGVATLTAGSALLLGATSAMATGTSADFTVNVPTINIPTATATLTLNGQSQTISTADASVGGTLEVHIDGAVNPTAITVACPDSESGAGLLVNASVGATVTATFTSADGSVKTLGPVIVDRTAQASAAVCGIVS